MYISNKKFNDRGELISIYFKFTEMGKVKSIVVDLDQAVSLSGAVNISNILEVIERAKKEFGFVPIFEEKEVPEEHDIVVKEEGQTEVTIGDVEYKEYK